jgi:hypothetical protein
MALAARLAPASVVGAARKRSRTIVQPVPVVLRPRPSPRSRARSRRQATRYPTTRWRPARRTPRLPARQLSGEAGGKIDRQVTTSLTPLGPALPGSRDPLLGIQDRMGAKLTQLGGLGRGHAGPRSFFDADLARKQQAQATDRLDLAPTTHRQTASHRVTETFKENARRAADLAPGRRAWHGCRRHAHLAVLCVGRRGRPAPG